MRLTSILLAGNVLLSPVVSHGADLPKEGTDSWTQSWVRMYVSSEMKVADHSVSEFELAGSTRNDKGGPMWNNFSFRGMGLFVKVGGKAHEPAANCVWADKDGDQIMADIVSSPDNAGDGTYTITAGTGKYAGITGNGEWHRIQILLPTSDKYVRGIFANTMHWRLPQ
jgi:hypothetical protein